MNIVEKFKKGHKIHIKKENRGKFTEYCGGKVTSECIARGKNSSDPAIRKRATFADNARKWKHKSGGQIVQKFKLRKAQEGTKFDWGGVASGGVQLLSSILGTAKLSKSANEALKAQRKAEANNIDNSSISLAAQDYINQLQSINPDANFGNIDYLTAKNMFERNARIQSQNQADINYQRNLYNLNQNLDQQRQDMLNSGMNSIISSIENFKNKNNISTGGVSTPTYNPNFSLSKPMSI